MCPLWPLHLVVMYGALLWPLLLLSCGVAAQVAGGLAGHRGLLKSSFCPETPDSPYFLDAQFTALWPNGSSSDLQDSKELWLYLDESVPVRFTSADLSDAELRDGQLYLEAADLDVAVASPAAYELSTLHADGRSWSGVFNVSASFLGKTSVRARLQRPAAPDRVSRCVPVVVTRAKRVIDTVFTASVACLVAIIFINFGCALDWDIVKRTVRRPVGPLIGFTSQYIVLPVISFGLGKLLFPDNIPMQLGLFFTGISPGGGASNIWTYLLGGNLNLSITMTSISTLAAFGMMPLWVFTLGKAIFDQGKLSVPYERVSEVALALVIPVFLGLLIQKYLPRVSKFLVRILKPFSTLLILFIVIFAIITNLYIFQLFTWKIILAGLGLPWLGYLTGLLLALAFKQPIPDVMAISVETGVHNTGISIFMLRTALGQPEADLTTVVPVAVAIMTPIPLTIWYVVKQLRSRWTLKKKDMYGMTDEERAPVTNNQSEPLAIITSKEIANNNRDKY